MKNCKSYFTRQKNKCLKVLEVQREKLVGASSIREEARIEAKITQLEGDAARMAELRQEIVSAGDRILRLEKQVKDLKAQAADRESLIGAFIEATGGKA